MSNIGYQLRQAGGAAAIGLFIAFVLSWINWIGVLDNGVLDRGFALFSKPITPSIAVVEVDAKSLKTIGQWPWNRGTHARLLNRLGDAGVTKVFVDIDFSAPSGNTVADQELAAALAQADFPIIFPQFWQPFSSTSPELLLTQPHPTFAPFVEFGLVGVSPDSDGLVRRLVHQRSSLGTNERSAGAVLANQYSQIPNTAYPLDFAYDRAAIERVSYVDLLQSAEPAAMLEGRVVFVGNTALELGDFISVPNHGAIPGVYVQVLSYLTLLDPIESAQPTIQFLLLILALGTVLMMRQGRWLLQVSTLVVVELGLVATTWAVQHQLGIQLYPAFAMSATFATVAATLIITLDKQRIVLLLAKFRYERQLSLINSIFQRSADGIIIVDTSGVINHANQAADAMLNAGEPIVEQPVGLFLPQFADLEGLAIAARHTSRSQHLRTWHGEEHCRRLLDLSISSVSHQETDARYLLIARDVTDQHKQAEQLQYQAAHDVLTDLPNRRYLMTRLDSAVREDCAAVLMIDLDRFKEINDALGHGIGDTVLAVVADRLRSVVPTHATLARFGGDEFSVCVPGSDRETALALAQELLETLRSAIQVAGVGLEVGASIGIALHPVDATTGQGLLQKADTALYQAKRDKSGIEVCSAGMNAPTVRQLHIAGTLRDAIEHSLLRMVYQPKIDMQTGILAGVEALARWEDAKIGTVSPDEFVGFAEQTDLIHPLTEWTLRRTTDDLRALEQDGHQINCAVNISARHFRDFRFSEQFRDLCEEQHMDPARFELEITESALMRDPVQSVLVARALRETGATLAVDDFGTGFSSLVYLKRFEMDCLKIDKCFVQDIVSSSPDRAIVQSLIDLSHSLGMKVVAEGIETVQQYNCLVDLGCDIAQGYYLARPMERDQLLSFLNEHGDAQDAAEQTRPKAPALLSTNAR